jgi:REP element-mobilizing transposase RayT
VLDSWRFLQRERGVRIYGYVILENHLHWIAAGEDLSEQVGRLKSFTARRILDEMELHGFATLLEELRFFKLRHKTDQTYQLWQEGSHPQQIQNEEMMRQKLEYMHHNPLRRGYVDDPIHWRYSSARNYAGAKGLIEVVTDWG